MVIKVKLPFEELVVGWAAETKPAPKTLYEWRRIFNQLSLFLGHDDRTLAPRLAGTLTSP
jgi:hypothetical protein